MKKIISLLFLPAFALNMYAQTGATGIIRGKIADTASGQSLANATISIIDINDSSAIKNTEAVKGGVFEINGIEKGRYRLLVSFQGYQNSSRVFSITKENPVIDFGTIIMERKNVTLQEVIVERSPITIKKDTIEFDAGSYKTKPNAVVEDLLKKLPGVQVDKSGNITAQGEQVTRVLVDGKRFFADDPKLATKNLPPDVVDKIQVFDDLSDQSKFTGFDDGNRVKTINIVTKKDKRKGYFGKVVAGAGSNETYDNSINIHRFNGNQQISLLGQANDINKQNFSIQDILGSSGGNGRGGGGRGGGGGGRGGGGGGGGGSSTGNGITTSWAGGLNYRDQWGKNTQAYGSYFYNNQHVSTNQQSLTQNLLTADSSTFTNNNQSSIRRNQNNRINFNIEQQFDSSNSLIFRPNVSFQNTNTSSSQTNVYTGGKTGTPIYSTVSDNSQQNSGNSGQYDLLFRHKFKEKFRTYSIDLNFQNNSNDGDGRNFSVNTYPSFVDTINQHIVTSSNGMTISPTISYTEPIGKNQILEFNYNYTYNKNTSNRYTYSFDSLAHAYDKFDNIYSNAFQNTYSSNRLSVNYRMQNPKFNFSAGSGIQSGKRNSINYTKKYNITQEYINLTPTVNFQYIFSRTQNLRINYSGRTGQPGVTQLQPIIATTDSINFSQGNANLKQQFTHSLRLLYTNFNPTNQRVIFATINASMTNNDIQNSITYLPSPPNKNGSTLTTPVNLNGTYALNGYFNYGFPLKKPKSNLNFSTNIGYNQSQTLVNLVSNYTKNTSLGETISWTTNLKDHFDMNFSSTSSYNIARNSLQPSQNLNYYSQVLSADLTFYTKNGWILATDFDYTYNGNRSAGYNSSVPLLNPGIAKQIFKNKQGEIRVTIFDLLNQNVSVTRSVTANTVQDTRTNVLTRYAMLTFTYNLRKFAGGQEQRMPQMFQRFRGMRGDAPSGGGNRRNGN
jgi:uncharacterized membrane protein YgcG